MNAVSVYAHWGLHNPSRGTLDFDGWKDWQPFLDMAKAVGLWVVFRPGPYINAETTGGGIPGWVLSETSGDLRSNNTDYLETWSPYIKAISKVIRRNQITEGGPIIAVQMENEYTDDETKGPPYKPQMMKQLRKAFIKAGIVVPLTHNDAGMNGYYVNGTGSPDLYGFDDYPQGFDCSHPLDWNNLTKSYHDYHMDVFPDRPLYIPEAQQGSFDPWGPSAPGYEKCRLLTDKNFQNTLYYHMLASNVKLINLYMIYGGTSWGNIPFPGVYTSYDYGSAIRENRDLSEKYNYLKPLGMFLRSVPELYHTDVVSSRVISSNREDSPALVTHLRNPDSGASFYFVRHSDASKDDDARYTLQLSTNSGELRLPIFYETFLLKYRTTELIVTDIKFGNSSLIYTSASIFFAGRMGSRDVLVLYGDVELPHEAIIQLKGEPNRINRSPLVSLIPPSPLLNLAKGTLISFLPGITQMVEVWDSDEQLILFCDTETANALHAPVLAGDSSDPFRSFWGIGSNNSIIVGGPYLVRSAILEDGTLGLNGDLKEDAFLRVIGLPKEVHRITWNGVDVDTLQSLRNWPSIVSLPLAKTISLLPLVREFGPWKYQDSLPEITNAYDDSDWVVANKTNTTCPYGPLFGSGPVLYACDYGFCEGAVLWRGYFNGSKAKEGVRLAINGGEAFAASIWINGHFLGTSYGNSTRNLNIVTETDETFIFPDWALRRDKTNVLTVLQDNMGMDETGWPYDANKSKSPRGVRGYSLLSGAKFTTWKVQGRAGGYRHYVDKHRGILNTGGFYGERLGWHLPEFDDSSWKHLDLQSGLPNDLAGVGFFRTQLNLDIPTGQDVMMSFEFEDMESKPYRALLFVNGWNMGKRVANLGPQTKFIVHEGILNYHGSNTIAISLWVMEPNQTVQPRLKLVIDAQFEGGVGASFEPGPSWGDLYLASD
ncbi:hypothetical protein FS842_006438 [Serendipita sp. 407]|nr:hypothetical protein FS842_006438 [Serendipita sp. 407]